jgi:hypothetical protein
LEGLHPQGEGDHGNGQRSLAGISVHHADIVQNRVKPSSKAPDSQHPLAPPTESSQADAPRTGAGSRPEIIPPLCISVHQGVAEQDSKIPISGPSFSQQKNSSVRGEGDLLLQSQRLQREIWAESLCDSARMQELSVSCILLEMRRKLAQESRIERPWNWKRFRAIGQAVPRDTGPSAPAAGRSSSWSKWRRSWDTRSASAAGWR